MVVIYLLMTWIPLNSQPIGFFFFFFLSEQNYAIPVWVLCFSVESVGTRRLQNPGEPQLYTPPTLLPFAGLVIPPPQSTLFFKTFLLVSTKEFKGNRGERQQTYKAWWKKKLPDKQGSKSNPAVTIHKSNFLSLTLFLHLQKQELEIMLSQLCRFLF